MDPSSISLHLHSSAGLGRSPAIGLDPLPEAGRHRLLAAGCAARSGARLSPRSAGFTLIELMIGVAVIGILAAIAYPSYSAFVRKSNRTDATRTMMQDAQALQRCYSQAYTYVGCVAAPAGTTNSPGGFYSITITITSPTIYSISGTTRPGPQAADTLCKTFVISSTGQQTAQNSGGADNTKTCWGTT